MLLQLIRSQGHDLTQKMAKSVSAHHLDKSLDVLRLVSGERPAAAVRLTPTPTASQPASQPEGPRSLTD